LKDLKVEPIDHCNTCCDRDIKTEGFILDPFDDVQICHKCVRKMYHLIKLKEVSELD